MAILVFGYMVAFVLAGLLTHWNRIVIWGVGPLVAVLAGVSFLHRRHQLPKELLIQLLLLLWSLTGLAIAVDYAVFLRIYRLLGELFVLAFIVIVAMSRRDAFRVAMWGILLAAAGLFVGFELTSQIPSMTVEQLVTLERVGGKNANAVGFLAAVGLSAVMALWESRRSPIQRVLVLLPVPLLLKGLISAASRSAFVLSLAFTLGWVLWAREPGRRRRLSKSIVSVALVVAIFLGLQWVMQRTYLGQRIQKFGTTEKLLVQNSRTQQYEEALRIFKLSPIWGVGAGQFAFYSSNHLMGHSDLAELLGTTGAIGVLLYLAMYWLTFHRMFVLLRTPGAEELVRRVRVVALLLLICFLGSLGRTNYLDPVAVVLYATVIAESYRLEHLVAQPGPSPKHRKLRASAHSWSRSRPGGPFAVPWPGVAEQPGASSYQ